MRISGAACATNALEGVLTIAVASVPVIDNCVPTAAAEISTTERTRRTIQELGEMMLELVDITTAQRRELEARQQQPDREHWQRHTY